MSPPANERAFQHASGMNNPLSIDTSSKYQMNEPIVAEMVSPMSEDEGASQVRRDRAPRTFSDPLPSPSSNMFTPVTPTSPQHSSGRGGNLLQQPKYGGHGPLKNTRFASRGTMDTRGSAVSPTMTSPISRAEMGKAPRRHSTEPRVNVHTQCGRHGDDWLFGGFSMSEKMRKIWEKKE